MVSSVTLGWINDRFQIPCLTKLSGNLKESPSSIAQASLLLVLDRNSEAKIRIHQCNSPACTTTKNYLNTHHHAPLPFSQL